MSVKKSFLFLFFVIYTAVALAEQPAGSLYQVDISTLQQAKYSHTFLMGKNLNPSGDVIQINSNSLLFNGKPQIPVMGEIHFSRVKEMEWKKELLKMRAGGVTVIATYVFWIHHEEIENEFDWNGQRNLHQFLQLCSGLNFPVVLRIGPWCHGEVRNGGFPEWLVKSGIKLRGDNPDYLSKVQKWYSQVYEQAKGMMWKDGGTIIGIQLENEYRGHGAHLMTLKKMAVDMGFDVPLYTRTGWPRLTTPVPYGEIIPLYGDYADGFWDRSTDEMPGDYSKSYAFRSFRNSTVIATEQLPQQADTDNPNDLGYPYFTCELGGGMMTSYHRRINIAPMDVYAMTLIRIGSGSNLPGYYMYHGGNNPEGKLTTLNEQQASSYTNHNDLPVESYDFQAPLGEFGQINPQYHLLRKLHIFLKDFGTELAMMQPHFPEKSESDTRRDSLLRWAVRSNGNSGYIFINNYQRLKELSPKKATQFSIKLSGEKLIIPQSPFTIPSGVSFFIPFNMDLEGVRMVYATAQPIARMEENGKLTYIFSQTEGIPAEFVFDKENLTVKSFSGKLKKVENRLYFSGFKTGTAPAIRLQTSEKKQITIILLNEKSSLKLWKGEFAGKERLFLTDARITWNKNELTLAKSDGEYTVSIFPAPKELCFNDKKLKSAKEGIFSTYKLKIPENKRVEAEFTKIQDMKFPLRTIAMGSRNVAEMPSDSDFDRAAVWQIKLPENYNTNRDIALRIHYRGDVARIYSGNKLLTDNFFNGKPMDVNLKYVADEIVDNKLTLKIIPLQKGMPVYFQAEAALTFGNFPYVLETPEIQIVENREIVLSVN